MRRILLLVVLLLPSFAFSQAKITISKTKVAPAETLTIQYSTSAALKPNSWIGIIPSSIPHGNESVNDQHDVAYQYTNEPSGTFTLEAPNKPGSYDLRWSGGGVELASVTFQVEAIDYKAELKLTKNTFNPDEDIEVSFSVASPLPKNAWIGLIPSDVPHGDETVNDQHDLNFTYVGGKTSGSWKLQAPAKAGSYDLRLNDTDNYGREIASVSFQVGEMKLEGTLKLEKEQYAPGENIDVTFTAADSLPRNAWVGMIPSDVPHGKEEVNDQHDIQYNYLEKKTSGTLHFVAPPEGGSYDFRMNSSDSGGVEITSVSFKVSGSLNADAMAKAIAEKGKITLYGIQFDFNQANIKPESEPVLKEVGSLLQNQADLKLRVEGHTDNVGKPAYNLNLSKKRAESVKAYLVQNFNIDAARLTTEGFGDTRPIAKNDTEQGRAQNRRVELAKQE
jgi:outer membrane protein OmpA-like peptidoglycan-associated protein